MLQSHATLTNESASHCKAEKCKAKMFCKKKGPCNLIRGIGKLQWLYLIDIHICRVDKI